MTSPGIGVVRPEAPDAGWPADGAGAPVRGRRRSSMAVGLGVASPARPAAGGCPRPRRRRRRASDRRGPPGRGGGGGRRRSAARGGRPFAEDGPAQDVRTAAAARRVRATLFVMPVGTAPRTAPVPRIFSATATGGRLTVMRTVRPTATDLAVTLLFVAVLVAAAARRQPSEPRLSRQPGRRRRREPPRHRGPRPLPVAGGRRIVRGQGLGQGPEHLRPRPARWARRAGLAGASGCGEVSYVDAVGVPRRAGSRLFFIRRKADQEKAVLYWRGDDDGVRPRPRRPQHPVGRRVDVARGVGAVHDGKTLAYALQENNADEATLYVKDVATGKVSERDRIEGAKYAVAVMDAGRRRVLLHVAAHRPDDPGERNGPAGPRSATTPSAPTRPATPSSGRPRNDPEKFFWPYLSRDGHWLLAYAGELLLRRHLL